MTDQEVLDLVRDRYIAARTSGKEGYGTHRPVGSAGRAAALWSEAIDEAEKRGLDWKAVTAAVRASQ